MPLKRIVREPERIIVEEKDEQETLQTKTTSLIPREIICTRCGNKQLMRTFATVVECISCGNQEFSTSEEFNVMCEVCKAVVPVKDTLYGQCKCRKSKEWRIV
jgi:ribosomal protein S27E